MYALSPHAWLMAALRAGAWLVILCLIFLPLEGATPVRRQSLWRTSTPQDLAFYFLGAILPPLVLAAPMAAVAWLAYLLVPADWHETVARWPLWVRGLSAFVVADLGFYWGHRWSHEIPLLWRFHQIHHAPKEVYFLISSRAHPIDFAVIRLCGLAPIAILGLGAPTSVEGTLIATLTMLLVTVWGFFIHANLRWRLGPLEAIFATPAFHLWHHALDGPRDRNFASMLPIWDRLFGTHHLPKGAWPSAFGIEAPLPTSVAAQLVHPFLPQGGASPLAPIERRSADAAAGPA